MKELYSGFVSAIKAKARGYQTISELQKLYGMLKYPREYNDYDAQVIRGFASDSQGVAQGYIDAIAIKNDIKTTQLIRRFLDDAGLTFCSADPNRWTSVNTQVFFNFFDNLLRSDTVRRSKPLSFPDQTISHADIWLGLHPEYRSHRVTPKRWFRDFLMDSLDTPTYSRTVRKNLIISMACCWDSYLQSLESGSQPINLCSANISPRRSGSSDSGQSSAGVSPDSGQSSAGASPGLLYWLYHVVIVFILVMSAIFLNMFLHVGVCFLTFVSSVVFAGLSKGRKASQARVSPVPVDMVLSATGIHPASIFNVAIDSVIDGFIAGYPDSRGMSKKSCPHGFSNRIKLSLVGQGMVVRDLANKWGAAVGILTDSSNAGELPLLHNYLLRIFPFDDQLADFDASGFVACLLRRVPISRGRGYEVSRIKNELQSCSEAFASQVTDLLGQRTGSDYWPVEDCRKALSTFTYRFVGDTNSSYRDIMNKLGFDREHPIYKKSSTICVPKNNLLGLYFHTRSCLRNELKIPHVLVELLLPYVLKEEVLDSLSYHLYNRILVQDLTRLSEEMRLHRPSMSTNCDNLFTQKIWEQEVLEGPDFEWRISFMPEKEFVHFVGDVVKNISDYDQSAIDVIKERLESVLNDNRGDLSHYIDVKGFDEVYSQFAFWPKLAARM